MPTFATRAARTEAGPVTGPARCAAAGVASPSSAARAAANHDAYSGLDAHCHMTDTATSAFAPLSLVFDRGRATPERATLATRVRGVGPERAGHDANVELTT